MDKKSVDILFDFLRDVLYDPENAKLNLDEFNDDTKKLAEGLQYFANCIEEQRELARALSKGNLSTKLPPPNNELAAPLKALHASLKHLTWQAEQVAKGDYQQRLDFMGEFAESFNTMTKQLDQRQKALQQEIVASQQKTQALEQSNSLLESITNKMSQWIIVVDVETKQQLFMNSAAKDALKSDATLKKTMQGWLMAQSNLSRVAENHNFGEIEMTFASAGKLHYYDVASYPIHWKEKTAVAYVFTDVSIEKEHMQKLESYAYQDTLTKLHNRFFGMGVLRDWLDDGREFSICFADLDNLKFVNDNFGHSEGDKYIINAAELLVNFSSASVASRLGGDEFMVLAPGFTQEQAEERMTEIRQSLINNSKNNPKGYVSSLSFGVVEVNKQNILTSSDLLGIADERMYEYKRANRMARGTLSPGTPVT